ncbi:MAG: hypothetical protein K8L91_05990 [Anaerolineae bacterium]|nr:hypothetical protein [Anaerolineae bacterium]
MGIEISLEEWVQYIFDNPEEDNSWEFTLQDPIDSDEIKLSYLTRLFENAGALLAPYSDLQVKNSLWYIGGQSGDFTWILRDNTLAWEMRERCIRAMYDLYASLFAVRCSPHLGHIDEKGANPINAICYMWWDILPMSFHEPPFHPVGLEVMARILTLDSIACQEGALHGLGHMPLERKDEVAAVINQFLERRPNIRPELRTYALAAKSGCIL